MHNSAFAALGLDCRYDAFDVTFESLRTAFQEFKDRGVSGLNVTLPHKERIMGLLDHVVEEAKAIGAVNTVVHRDGQLVGYNTDAAGFSRAVEPLRASIAGSTVLLLGAGGAARAVAYALLDGFFPERLIIANRSRRRAQDLAARCEALGTDTRVEVEGIAEWELKQAVEISRLIVNSTSLGMDPQSDGSPLTGEIPFRGDQIAVDLVYTPLETTFLRRAASAGARTISGLEMFLYQGARSFELWTGQPMPLNKVRPVIERELRKPTT
jgi:shikimate dehydrogenase